MSLESMSDVEVALAAAAAGAAVVRAAYGGEHLRHMKSDSDFATETDLELRTRSSGWSRRRGRTTA
jgi:hypothetical protein